MIRVKLNEWVLRDGMIWFEINGRRLGETKYVGSEMKWNGIKYNRKQ